MGYTKESGFTLVELLVVLGIIGVLSGAMAMTFDLVTKTNSMAMEQSNALIQVHMAGSWISKDVKSAYELLLTPELCSMNCRKGANFDNYTITYKIDGSTLKRTSQGLLPVGEPQTITIARFIDPATSFVLDPGGNTGTFTVTAHNNQSSSDNITRIYKLKVGY